MSGTLGMSLSDQYNRGKRIPSGKVLAVLILFCALFSDATIALAWHDETHLAVAKAAGYAKWYNAAGPDIAKIKAGFTEERNHYSDNRGIEKVTIEQVLEQANRYNDPDDMEGHLYGAIIASLRAYTTVQKGGKYAQYHLAYCAHYIGDLAQPFHNTPFDEFNKMHHEANDGIVEREVSQRIDKIKKFMYRINLRPDHFEEDLAKEIVRIANLARELEQRLRKDNRDMSQDEAYRQLGHSAALLEAALASLNQRRT